MTMDDQEYLRFFTDLKKIHYESYLWQQEKKEGAQSDKYTA